MIKDVVTGGFGSFAASPHLLVTIGFSSNVQTVPGTALLRFLPAHGALIRFLPAPKES